jgi:hypothetical protein
MCLAQGVRHVKTAYNALLCAQMNFDDAGYSCEALNDLHAGAAELIADWYRRKRLSSVPDHIAEAARQYRQEDAPMNRVLPEHIDKAAIWATAHWWNSPRPLLPYLKRKFKLTDDEAMDAIRSASDAIMRGKP